MALPDFDKINRAIKDWEIRTLAKIKRRGRGMNIRHRPGSDNPNSSLDKMRTKESRRRGDLISSISFIFRRSLIYTYYGAGKGRGGKKGSTWYDEDGKRHKTNPKSLGKAGTGGRTAKPFLDVVEDEIDELADVVTEKTGDVIVANIFGKHKTGR